MKNIFLINTGIHVLVKARILFITGLILLFNPFHSPDLSASEKISLHLRDKTIKDAIELIKEETGYSFFLDTRDLDLSKKVTMDASGKTIREILDLLLKNEQVAYEIKDQHIIITSGSVRSTSQTVNESFPVQGVVKDSHGEFVIGANIRIKGESTGTITDIDGRFTLQVSIGTILEISYIGYQSQDIKINNRNPLNIMLREDTQFIDEVVVIGYGTRDKKALTSSLSTIQNEK